MIDSPIKNVITSFPCRGWVGVDAVGVAAVEVTVSDAVADDDEAIGQRPVNRNLKGSLCLRNCRIEEPTRWQ